jgi:peptidase E
VNPARGRQILACSGAGYPPDDAPPELVGAQVRQAIALAGTTGAARVCFIGTAVGDSQQALDAWYALRPRLGAAELSHLQLFPQPNVPDLRAHLLSQDVIWVSGGSLVNLLAVWRAHQLDVILRECWEAGVVLAGTSAGSVCWHAGGVTDSYGDSLDAVADCLGFLPFSNGVHDDLADQPRRRRFRELIAAGSLPGGYATEDGVALHYVGTELAEALAIVPGSKAWQVTPDGPGAWSETPIPARLWLPPLQAGEQARFPKALDTTVAHQARVYDYWLGGKDNFAVDREAAEQALAVYPGLRRGVRAQRAFLANVVRYLAGPAGIRQFLDVGTGIPTANNTHEVAQEVAPACRIVYADNDPMVLAHARALLTSSAEGATTYVDCDLRDTARLLREAADVLDFSQPLAILLIGILQLIPDEDEPYAIVARLVEAVPPGSWLAVFHPASDILPEQMRAVARRPLAARGALRSRPEVIRFFESLDLLEPGVVQVHRWQPGWPALDDGEQVAGWAGLAQKSWARPM